MSYYNTCPECGSNLDPGERCTCKKGVTTSADQRITPQHTAEAVYSDYTPDLRECQ